MKRSIHPILLLIVVGFSFVAITAVSTTAQEKPKNPLVGNWLCKDDGTKVLIRADGTVAINDVEYTYKIKNSVITVTGDDGALAMPFELDGDTLTVTVEGRDVVYTRVKAGAKTVIGNQPPQVGGVAQALVGKWCYMSNLTGTNSRMSNRCFVLNANGTYEYSSETSSSGTYGGTASQEYDAGRWSVAGNTLTAISNTRGKAVYSIVLRNHPKTGDPMIVVDGDAYVTAYQKRPW